LLDSLLQEIDEINRLKRGLGPAFSTKPINVSLFSTSFPQEVIYEVLVLNPAEKRSSTIHKQILKEFAMRLASALLRK